VAFQAARLAVGVHTLNREEATQRQRGVQRRRSVRLGEDQPVAARPPGIVRPDAQLVEVQHGQQLGHGERAADVPPHAIGDHLDAEPPNLVSGFFQHLMLFR